MACDLWRAVQVGQAAMPSDVTYRESTGDFPHTGAVVMNIMRSLSILSLCVVTAPCFAQSSDAPANLTARVVAVGIPGAGALAPVGTFHPGGPIRDKPDLAAFTQAGRVLDAKRVLVASSSNFGAARAHANAAEGSVLSIDPDGP